MANYPPSVAQVDQTAPVPRRIRAVLNGQVVLDTTAALYVWETPHYPQYYIPVSDVNPSLLVDESDDQTEDRSRFRRYALRAGDVTKPNAVQIIDGNAIGGVAAMARVAWDAVDAWFEEDEEVFVHPRNPYTRVDALRSTRRVRVEIAGVLLADSTSSVMVFETGLPTRYYLNRTEVNLSLLTPVDTTTACPYKGVTSDYGLPDLARRATQTLPGATISRHGSCCLSPG